MRRVVDKNPDRPKGDLELEPDDQSGGHYYRVTGKTVSDGKHTHGVTTWHSDGRAALSSPKKKAAAKKKKKKVPDIEDPDAELSVDLVNRRLLADRHPATGRKISGKKADQMMWLLLDQKMARLMDGDRVTRDDMEERLDKIDETHRAEFPTDKPPPSGVDPSNILAENAKRGRQKPDRLADKQPDAFVAERTGQGLEGAGMPASKHDYRSWMRGNLKQYGGNMRRAAEAYKQEQAGGHYARMDGTVNDAERQRAKHRHKPVKNPSREIREPDSDTESEGAPSPPARRITRNMDPREARRIGRTGAGYDMDGSGHGDMDGSGHDDLDGEGYDDLDGEGIMDWLSKHPITEDVVLGGLGAVATVATGGLADAAFGAVGTAVDGLTASAEGAAEDDATGLLRRGLTKAKGAASSLYEQLPTRQKVAEGLVTATGEQIFGSELKDAGGDDAPPSPTPPSGPSASDVAGAQFNANYQALYGHLHEQPYTGSIWG